MVLDVVLDNSTQLVDDQYWVLDKQIISFFSIVESLYLPFAGENQGLIWAASGAASVAWIMFCSYKKPVELGRLRTVFNILHGFHLLVNNVKN